MFRFIKSWYARTVTPRLVLQSQLTYDMTHWESRTFRREILEAIMMLMSICVGWVVVVIIVISIAQGALWLAYIFLGCLAVRCLVGMQPFVHKLWLIAKVLKEKRRPKKVRH